MAEAARHEVALVPDSQPDQPLLYAAEDFWIAAGTRVVGVQTVVHESSPYVKGTHEGIVTPMTESFTTLGAELGANAQLSGGNIRICLKNIANEPVLVQKGTPLARFCPIASAQVPTRTGIVCAIRK